MPLSDMTYEALEKELEITSIIAEQIISEIRSGERK